MYKIQKDYPKNHMMLNRKTRPNPRFLPHFYFYQLYDAKSQVYNSARQGEGKLDENCSVWLFYYAFTFAFSKPYFQAILPLNEFFI